MERWQGWFVLLLVAMLAGTAYADSESDAAAAEKAGRYREALDHYVAALQAAPETGDKSFTLRKKIIELAGRLKPTPQTPKDAERYLVRGEAAFERAKSPADYEYAVKEFRVATNTAPWLADAYFNLGVAQEKAGKSREAITSFRFYLLAAPGAQGAAQVEKRIYKLEYDVEQSSPSAQAAREQEESKRAGVEKKSAAMDLSALSGAWAVEIAQQNSRDLASARAYRGSWIKSSGRAQISTSGRTIRITKWSGEYRFEYEGIVNARNISGTVTTVRPPLPSEWVRLGYRDVCNLTKFPFEGTISESAGAIVLIDIGGAEEITDERTRLVTCKPGTFNIMYRLSR